MVAIWFVIAAWNEERNIAQVVGDLRKKGYKNIVVVDDCSGDATFERAQRAGAVVLRHIINRGQGAALQTGIDYALAHGADALVTFDGDGQHRVEDLPAMLKPVLSGKADVSLGSRFLKPPKNIPFWRRMTLRIAVLVQNIFYGINLTDAHNGFRVFSRKAAQRIRITADRMAHASELAEQIHVLKLSFVEVPVHIVYTDETLRHGQGSFWQGVVVFWDMVCKKLMR